MEEGAECANLSHNFCPVFLVRDVSKVTSFEDVFEYCKDFNEDLSAWDVSSATNMGWMCK